MRVIATQKGYYGSVVRDPGDEFGLHDEAHFSAAWMKPANGEAAPKPRVKREKAVPHVAPVEVLPPVEPAPEVDPITGPVEGDEI